MRALVEDTKKLAVNNNNNNNTTTSTTTSTTPATTTTATNPAKTSFTNKTYKMQQQQQHQQQQQQQTTITNTTKAGGVGGTSSSLATKTITTSSSTTSSKPATSTAKPTTSTAKATASTAVTAGVKLRAKPQPNKQQPIKQQQQQQSQPQKKPQKQKQQSTNYNNNVSSAAATTSSSSSSSNVTTISLPKASHANTSEEIAGGVQDTIYLCNFRVSVDGEWLCLRELQDIDSTPVAQAASSASTGNLVGQRHSYYGQRHNKRYNSSSDRHSYGGGSGGSGGLDDNGIFALHNFIAGRRLYDQDNDYASSLKSNFMLTAPQARESSGFVGVFGVGGGDTKQCSNEWSNLSRDPAEIERSNLVNICKLVVKELLEQSVRYGRMLDSDHLPLQHFFIVIEHVLGHGLRTKKGLLGPRKELWDLLQCVETICPEAQDITASVRDLPTVRTHIGRARAWLRIALMQKKLADYLQALIEHREDALYDYYEPHALMMSDEIVIIMGILVGLNVIDCNLCVKEEDLDSQQGVIDFSLYLRTSSRSSDLDDADSSQQQQQQQQQANMDATGQGNMIAVLDQKNYIEELNRHLNATVGNLQAKVESLTTTNALMKEDLAIARNSLLALQAENQAMRQNSHGNSGPPSIQSADSTSKDKESVDSMKKELEKEKKKSEELEKDLKIQIALKAESDMAMKLLEKNIHEKQDTIVSLRHQLDEIKQINLEMYRKLQECEASLKHKTELLSKLESQKEDMASTISHLEKKWSSDKSNLGEILKNTSQTLSTQVNASEERAARAETEARIEREWRMSLQEKEGKLKDKLHNLQTHIQDLTEQVQSNDRLKLESEKIRKQWSEAQTTLEELGIQLSESKLKIAEFKESDKRKQQQMLNTSTSSSLNETGIGAIAGAAGAGIWAPDSITRNCTGCNKEFNLTRRKHHCRSCGEIFCKSCSDHTLPLMDEKGQLGKPVRVCLSCFASHK